jgi:hypothetical protein
MLYLCVSVDFRFVLARPFRAVCDVTTCSFSPNGHRTATNMPPILPAPQRRLLGLIAFLVLSLTVYSALYDLSSQPTPSPSSAVDSLAGEGLLPSEWAEQKDDRGYFASKGNVLNQWSVPLSELFLLAGSSSGQHG